LMPGADINFFRPAGSRTVRASAAGPLSQAFRLAPRRRGGLELEVLGLNIGIDAAVPALKLPAIGRLPCCDLSLLFDRV
jgi:hypothetical protein